MLKQLKHLLMATVMGAAMADAAAAQAPLQFSIDPTQGLPGGTVAGQVNPADIAANCVTTLEGLQAEFQALFDGPYAAGAPEGELFMRFFPTGEFVFENCSQAAYSLTGITVLGIAANIMGAAETAFPQTFVQTFADIATQEPVGELGHFDPVTGVGAVVVPDVDPGVWAVAAACVVPVLDIDMLEEGIQANGALLESLGFPTCDINDPAFSAYVEVLLGPGADLFTFLNAFGPQFIQSIVTPGALGVQAFTVLGPDTPTPTVTPTVPTATPTVPPPGCPDTPATGCLSPAKGNLVIKNPGNPAKSSLVWKWLKGPAQTQGDFGDPVSGATDYNFCVYAGTAAADLNIERPGGAGWQAISTKGYKFKDTTGAVDGIIKAQLKGGDAGKSKVLVKGKGASLDLSSLPLDAESQVVVQLIRRDATNCWETVFPLSAIGKDEATKFKAKFP